MKTVYVSTHRVLATPMDRGEYNKVRGWDTPFDENPNDKGHMLEYLGRTANTPISEHYVTWIPVGAFEREFVACKPDTYITRMETELSELQDRLGKLSAFLVQQTAKPTLSVEDLSDLFFQEKLMQELAALLSKRLVKARAMTC